LRSHVGKKAIAPYLLLFMIGLAFVWFLHPSPQRHLGKGFYAFFGRSEDLVFNRINLNLTYALQDRMLAGFTFDKQRPSVSLQLDFRVRTGPNPEIVGFVSPWTIGKILTYPTRSWNCTIKNLQQFSIIYLRPHANITFDVITLQFELDSDVLQQLSFFEFSAILPFPPISERVEVGDVMKELNGLLEQPTLIPMTARFKPYEGYGDDMPTFIEIDIPRNCIVREAQPFYSIGITKDSYFLSWSSHELKMLGKGSYSASVMATLEEPNLKHYYYLGAFFVAAVLGALSSYLLDRLLDQIGRGLRSVLSHTKKMMRRV